MIGESNTIVSAYTLYRDLQQYCSHPSKCENLNFLSHVSVYIDKPLNLSARTDVQCSVKSGINASAKNINTGQPAWTVQTDSI